MLLLQLSDFVLLLSSRSAHLNWYSHTSCNVCTCAASSSFYFSKLRNRIWWVCSSLCIIRCRTRKFYISLCACVDEIYCPLIWCLRRASYSCALCNCWCNWAHSYNFVLYRVNGIAASSMLYLFDIYLVLHSFVLLSCAHYYLFYATAISAALVMLVSISEFFTLLL